MVISFRSHSSSIRLNQLTGPARGPEEAEPQVRQTEQGPAVRRSDTEGYRCPEPAGCR